MFAVRITQSDDDSFMPPRLRLCVSAVCFQSSAIFTVKILWNANAECTRLDFFRSPDNDFIASNYNSIIVQIGSNHEKFTVKMNISTNYVLHLVVSIFSDSSEKSEMSGLSKMLICT